MGQQHKFRWQRHNVNLLGSGERRAFMHPRPRHHRRSPPAPKDCRARESFLGRCVSSIFVPLSKISMCIYHGCRNLLAHSECQEVASWDAPSPNPDLAVDRVVSLHHFAGSLTTCLVLEGGDIVVVQEPESSSPSEGVHIEIMGSVDEGITAASWSPDEELLAITTKASTVIFMSRTFDGVTDMTMTAEDLKASKHVSVGWGKKETQFQGRGAKALRDPTIPEKVDQGVISPSDNGKTSISWRGDGVYVAISTIEDGIRRVIRVYSRDGVLDSASEPIDYMESALSWRPVGNLIASIQRLEDRVDVIFFERNGLRHGQFSLRSPEGRTLTKDEIHLSWNADSTVLAVALEDRIQLWTMGNYHWYLKQEIPVESQLRTIAWHPEKPLRYGAATASKLTGNNSEKCDSKASYR